MKISKITIIPDEREITRQEIEPLRSELIKKFTGKVYFETTGEVVADCVIEKELKEIKQNKK